MTLTFFSSIYNEIRTTPSFSIQASLSKHGTPTRASSGSMGNITINAKHNNEKNRHKDLAQSKTAIALSTAFERLDGSVDVQAAIAETYFYNSEYKKCTNILEK